jgi:hypothetical protein
MSANILTKALANDPTFKRLSKQIEAAILAEAKADEAKAKAKAEKAEAEAKRQVYLEDAAKEIHALSGRFGSKGKAKRLAEFDPSAHGVWRSTLDRSKPSRTSLCVLFAAACLLGETPVELEGSQTWADLLKRKPKRFDAMTFQTLAYEAELHHWGCTDYDHVGWYGAMAQLDQKGVFRRVGWGMYEYTGGLPRLG